MNLYEAIRDGDTLAVTEILGHVIDINAEGGEYGNALQAAAVAAAYGKNEAIVRLLLDRGADINAQGGKYGNALQAAAYRGNEAIVRLLLERGADINAQSSVRKRKTS